MGRTCDPPSHDPVVVMKFVFCAHSARLLLRKLDHVLLWILSTNNIDCDDAESVQSKENFND